MELIPVNDGKYEEYETLLLERDQALKEAGQTWTAYLQNFGRLLTDLYEVKIDCIKCKKTIAYYQNAINHGGVVDANAMQEYLRKEMAEYYANLKKMLADSERCRKAKDSTAYEVQRSKTLYRRLAKLLHPDINPETDSHEELLELWNRITYAYALNDIKALSELEVLVRKALKDLGLGRIKIEIPDIEDRIEELKKEIEQIRTTTPYIYRDLLNDDEEVEKKKQELAEELEEYRSYKEKLNAVIEGMLAGGQITLQWHMNG